MYLVQRRAEKNTQTINVSREKTHKMYVILIKRLRLVVHLNCLPRLTDLYGQHLFFKRKFSHGLLLAQKLAALVYT